ncbi:unnamed protein product [Effrenium voratum]|nr:unnamed protein product [Effrenium voratum]
MSKAYCRVASSPAYALACRLAPREYRPGLLLVCADSGGLCRLDAKGSMAWSSDFEASLRAEIQSVDGMLNSLLQPGVSAPAARERQGAAPARPLAHAEGPRQEPWRAVPGLWADPRSLVEQALRAECMNLRGMGQGTCGQCQLKGRDCIQETIIVFNPEHSSPPCCGLSEVPLPHAAHAGAVGFVIALALSTAVWLKPERKMTPEEYESWQLSIKAEPEEEVKKKLQSWLLPQTPGFFQAPSGHRLHVRTVLPADDPSALKVKAVILYCHGMNSHVNAGNWAGQFFPRVAQEGFAMVAVDIMGPGLARGLQGFGGL